VGTAKGLSAFGYVLAATLFCAACSGLPILAGLLGGFGVGARFGVSAGLVSAVVLTYSLLSRRRSRGARACAVPSLGVGAEGTPANHAIRPVSRL